MTIARGLILLLAIPLLALAGLGYFVINQMAGVEKHSRFVVDLQVASVATLGNVMRCYEDSRVSIRNYLLAEEKAERDRAEAALGKNQEELNRLIKLYSETLISSDEDRRMCTQFQDLNRRWSAEAQKLIALSTAGRRPEALTLIFTGTISDLGLRATNVLREWIEYNEHLAKQEGATTLLAIRESRRNLLIAIALAMAISGVLGYIMFGRIVVPIRALQSSVETIAQGNYAQPVPFTRATNEIGGLARSIEVLKAGAATMAEQRWVKANIARLTGMLQGATSHAEFGKQLLSGLVPVLGGGVAGFYLFEQEQEQLLRVAGYGLAESAAAADRLRVGEGLAGQCARDRSSTVLGDLPPDYLRISSGLGEAAPAQATAWPIKSRDDTAGGDGIRILPCVQRQ